MTVNTFPAPFNMSTETIGTAALVTQTTRVLFLYENPDLDAKAVPNINVKLVYVLAG